MLQAAAASGSAASGLAPGALMIFPCFGLKPVLLGSPGLRVGGMSRFLLRWLGSVKILVSKCTVGMTISMCWRSVCGT